MRYRARAWRRSHRLAATLLAVAVALTGGLVLTLAAGAVRTASAPDRYTAAHPEQDFDLTIEQAAGVSCTSTSCGTYRRWTGSRW